MKTRQVLWPVYVSQKADFPQKSPSEGALTQPLEVLRPFGHSRGVRHEATSGMPKVSPAAALLSCAFLIQLNGAGGQAGRAAVKGAEGGGGGRGGGGGAAVSDELLREINQFEAMKLADPKNVSVLYSLGMLYQLAGKPKEVCDNLHGAYIESEGGTPPELLFHLANNLKAIGENDAAINFYFLAITMQPEAPVNWVLASISLDFVGRSKMAVRGYQTVLRLGPTARIVSWVDIYMLSALAKANFGKRAVHRYNSLVGYPTRMPSSPALVHPPPVTGNVLDTSSGRVVSLDVVHHRVSWHDSYSKASSDFWRSWAESPSWRTDADAETAARLIAENQAPAAGCGRARFLIVELARQDGKTGKIGKEIHGFGLGAQMHVLSVALSYALATGRTLVTRDVDNWWYTDAADCPARSFTCYYRPLSTCTETQVMDGLRAEKGWSGEVRRLGGDSLGDRVVLTDCRLDNFLNLPKEHRTHVPSQFVTRGLLWWRAQLTWYILRPNPATLEVLEAEKARLKWGQDVHVTGMHVRHGDKKTESSVVPMGIYLEAAHGVSLGKNPQSKSHVVYLSTDDHEAVDIARAWTKDGPGGSQVLDVMVRDDEVRGVSTATDQLLAMHNVNATRYGMEAIANLWLLSHCQSFVGTFSSNFGRLAYELAYARFGGKVFAASMDVFWHAYP